MEFDRYPETKFFKPHQIQKIKADHFSDKTWDLSQENRKFIHKYVDAKLNGNNSIDISISLNYAFTRKVSLILL